MEVVSLCCAELHVNRQEVLCVDLLAHCYSFLYMATILLSFFLRMVDLSIFCAFHDLFIAGAH